MSRPKPVEYTKAAPEVRAVFDDIKAKRKVDDVMFGELMAVVGMANQTNRFAEGYRLPIDAAFD
ncbi:MAG TPA: hypothetical protein VFB13_19270 [Reyranella sp.]|nr:hypothetical protein [Reyranella sp.]